MGSHQRQSVGFGPVDLERAHLGIFGVLGRPHRHDDITEGGHVVVLQTGGVDGLPEKLDVRRLDIAERAGRR